MSEVHVTDAQHREEEEVFPFSTNLLLIAVLGDMLDSSDDGHPCFLIYYGSS